jgi:hypothetical protein
MAHVWLLTRRTGTGFTKQTSREVPGDGPALGGDGLSQTSLAPLFLEKSTLDGGERLDRDKEGGSGGAPCGAVLCKATARANRVAMGVILPRPPPGGQAPEPAGAVGAKKTLVFGEPCEALSRGLEQGLVGEALTGTDQGA